MSVSITLCSDVFVGFIICTSSSLSSSLPYLSSSSFLVNCSIISSSVKRDSVQTKPSSTFNKLFEVNSGARSSFRARKLSISSVSALKGSSSSLIAATCWSFHIPAFQKQLMILSSVTLSQAKTSIFMASGTLNDGIPSSFSRAVIIRLTDKILYFNFSDKITP